ncbi:hypothetical protein BKP42_17780 [Rhodococcus erythropolis]|nr:hypothetical protein BKP42_17780 [Rhodococcus erythropolis]
MFEPETVDTTILVIFIGTAISAVAAIVMPWASGRTPRTRSTPYDNYRRVFGLLAAVPMPWFRSAFCAASVPGIFLIPIKPLNGWPRWSKALIGAAIGGAFMVAASAFLQGVPLPVTAIASLLAAALFASSAVKLTACERDAGQLISWTAAGHALFFILIGTSNTSDTFEHLWKYGIATPVTIILIYMAVSTGRTWLSAALLATLGVASMSLGFRSHALVCLISMVILIAKGASSRPRWAKVGVAIVGIYALAILLPNSISSGAFGADVQARTIAQEQVSDAPAFLAGRVEPPFSIAAISEKPLLGWGNLNKIDHATEASGVQIARDLGMENPDSYRKIWIREGGQVSLHSVFFESWAAGGVLAAGFPALLICLFSVAVIQARGQYAALVVLVSVQGLWDVIFSPWGYNRPILFAISAVLACWCITEHRRVKNKPRPHSVSDPNHLVGRLSQNRT